MTPHQTRMGSMLRLRPPRELPNVFRIMVYCRNRPTGGHQRRQDNMEPAMLWRWWRRTGRWAAYGQSKSWSLAYRGRRRALLRRARLDRIMP